jgi:transcriptional regulator with XRE-family HTH domain
MPKKLTKSQTLGERIRKMRESLNVNLESLAHKTGYDPEYLAEIEEGKTSPPVGALIQISRALAVDSATFLSEEKKKERAASHQKRTRAYSYESLTPEAEDKHLWAYLVTLDPKKEHAMVAYQHEGEEFVFVLEGKVEIMVGDEVSVIKQGESLHFNSAIQHNLRNLSTKQTKLLVVVYTP